MTSEPPRDAAAVRVFPPGVPLLTILLGAGLQRLWPLHLGVEIPTLYRYGIGGAIAVGSFLGLGLYSVLIFRSTGQNENPWKPTPGIVERGPFRLTRNPMYLQMVLVCVGFAMILMNPWIVLLTPACAWTLQRFCHSPRGDVPGTEVRRFLSDLQTAGAPLALSTP